MFQSITKYNKVKLSLFLSGHTKTWLGLHRPSSVGPWQWLDTSLVSYTNWEGWGPGTTDDVAVGHYYTYSWWWYSSYTFKWLAEAKRDNNKYIYICKKSILDRTSKSNTIVKVITVRNRYHT